MTRVARIIAAGAAIGLLTAAQGRAQDETKAAAARTDARLEIEYGFVVERGDKTSEEAMMREVKSGERFHVRVRPRQTAYAYLFVTGKDGAFDLVLPGEADKRNSQIRASQWGFLPEKDWMKFDTARGVEHLYLFVSSSKIEDIEELFAKGQPESVDETWLLDLRNTLIGESTETITRAAALTRVAQRRRGGPAVIVQQLDLRHK